MVGRSVSRHWPVELGRRLTTAQGYRALVEQGCVCAFVRNRFAAGEIV